MFFFEKKNQKTFVHFGSAQMNEVFSASFFFRKKKSLPC